ncbi:MAG: zinc ABC transporter substrate-binding protein [Anaerolineae bacterium]|nr:zinc ABC transporter substrate-binding protein [Anaerolineae bacterium]
MGKLVRQCAVVLSLLAAIGCALPACSPTSPDADGLLRVVATTTIVGDVTRQVGGEHIELTVLLPVGSDPHTYEPAPQDIAALSQADVILINGAGLETFLEPLLDQSGADTAVVSVSDGIVLRHLGEDDHHQHGPGDADPHVWLDPHNVIVWVQNIERALSQLDPVNAEIYTANAAAYRTELEELDAWIQAQVAQIAGPERRLVADHAMLGYFADRYGFEQVGAVLPGFSTLAEPSAQERAELEEAILALDVGAIFVGVTSNPRLAQQIARDTGIQVVPLYTGSLSASGGPAENYLALMRYNVTAIVTALQ